MDKLKDGLTEEEIEAATKELRISEKDLLAEIVSVLKDYFIGGFDENGKSVTYSLLNGQKFRITVREVSA